MAKCALRNLIQSLVHDTFQAIRLAEVTWYGLHVIIIHRVWLTIFPYSFLIQYLMVIPVFFILCTIFNITPPLSLVRIHTCTVGFGFNLGQMSIRAHKHTHMYMHAPYMQCFTYTIIVVRYPIHHLYPAIHFSCLIKLRNCLIELCNPLMRTCIDTIKKALKCTADALVVAQ